MVVDRFKVVRKYVVDSYYYQIIDMIGIESQKIDLGLLFDSIERAEKICSLINEEYYSFIDKQKRGKKMYKNIELIKQLTFERNVLGNRLRAAYIRMDYIEADIVLDLITTINILLEKLQK